MARPPCGWACIAAVVALVAAWIWQLLPSRPGFRFHSPLRERGATCFDLIGEAYVRAAAMAPGPLQERAVDYNWEAVLERYTTGGLDDLVDEYRKLLLPMPQGLPPMEPRQSGVGTPYERFIFPADPQGKPRLVLTGDSITHGAPMNPSAAYALAVALRNPSLYVENRGWGGIMSMSLLSPWDFGVSLPRPGELSGQYVAIFIGANDAMAMTSHEPMADLMYVGEPGGPCRLPEDWRTRCPPSPGLYEASLQAMVRLYKASGARVALATPLPLGEGVAPDPVQEGLGQPKYPPLATVAALKDAVHRVAQAEGCAVLPLFECAHHRHLQLQRPRQLWTPEAFQAAMGAQYMHRLQGGNASWNELPLPWPGRPELMHDLVHLNENGAALYAALVQVWLDAERVREASKAPGATPLQARGATCLDLIEETNRAAAALPRVSGPAPGGAANSSWDADRAVARYKAGELDAPIEGYRKLLAMMPNGLRAQEPRPSGAGNPWGKFVPHAEAAGLPRLVLAGDSITHGPPMSPSSPFAAALAVRNPAVFVENHAWGGLMSMSLLSPADFGLPLPRPAEVKGEYVVIFIGANDAIAMAATDKMAHVMYGGPSIGRACKLPGDWRARCRPSPELFEASLRAAARLWRASGARVALATPMPLGEVTSDELLEGQHRRPPFAVVRELAAAVRRVAAAEGCDVLPLFECAAHRLQQLQRPPFAWTPAAYSQAMQSQKDRRWKQGFINATWYELEPEGKRPELMHDLVHLNEHGAAIVAGLVQAWLDAQRP